MEIKKKQNTGHEKVAAIQIRSSRGMRSSVKDTLFMLNMRKKNACVILNKTPSIMGMLKKAADQITYGDVSEETVQMLEKSKLRRVKTEKATVYFMHPPRGGFERKGVKQPYTTGGALGYRKKNMADLIKKMI